MPSRAPETDPHRNIVAQLNAEWDEIRREPATWITGSPSLGDVLQSIRFNPDRVLIQLITASQSQYYLAGRVIIQALLPKLILLSHTFPYPGVDTLISGLWIRISTYPVDRRLSGVAANLILDTRKDVLSETRSAPDLRLVVNPDAGMTADHVLSTARTLNLATPESLAIVEKVYVDQVPRHEVAQIYDLSAAAVRRRCSDTVRRLRDNRELLAA